MKNALPAVVIAASSEPDWSDPMPFFKHCLREARLRERMLQWLSTAS